MAAPLTLNQIVAQTRNVVAEVIASGGVLSPENELLQIELEKALPIKIDQYAYLMQALESEAEHFKAVAKEFEDLAAGCEKTYEFLKERIKNGAVALKLNEVQGHNFKFVISDSNPSVEINNEDLIPEAFKKTKTTVSIDKKLIAEELKLGMPVAGASLKYGKSIRISKNRKAGA